MSLIDLQWQNDGGNSKRVRSDVWIILTALESGYQNERRQFPLYRFGRFS